MQLSKKLRASFEPHAKVGSSASNENGHAPVSDTLGLDQLKTENSELKDRLKKMEESLRNMELERDKSRAPQSRGDGDSNLDYFDQNKLKLENQRLENSLKEMEESISRDRERSKSLESQVRKLEQENEEWNKEQDRLIEVFAEERNRRDGEEENLRKKLKDASNARQQLLDRVRELEKLKPQNFKVEP